MFPSMNHPDYHRRVEWIVGLEIFQDDLQRLERCHPDRREEVLRNLCGNRRLVREYLGLHPQRRPQFLQSLRIEVSRPGL